MAFVPDNQAFFSQNNKAQKQSQQFERETDRYTDRERIQIVHVLTNTQLAYAVLRESFGL